METWRKIWYAALHLHEYNEEVVMGKVEGVSAE
jgi:hypothetical protein